MKQLGPIINAILNDDGSITYDGCFRIMNPTPLQMDAVVQKEEESKEEKTLDSIEESSKDGNSWMSGTTMEMWKEYEDQ